jgi:hypothetical protein
MSFSEAMNELSIPESATPAEKMRAVCQWELGYPQWFGQFCDWLDDAGYELKEKENRNDTA